MRTTEPDRIRTEVPVHVPIYDATGSIDLARRQLHDEGVQISFGLKDLDAATGGMRRGYFVVIGARSGNGKTTFLLNLLHRLHHGPTQYRICYIGTEMDPSTLYRKWAARICALNEDDVLQNRWHNLPPGAKEGVDDELVRLADEWRTWLPPISSPSFDDLTKTIEVARSDDFKADILILDHLHRIVPPPRRSEREALNDLCVLLKTAAVEENMLVITAAQLRREEHGVFDLYRPPHQGSFLGSSAIEGNADMGIGLFRPLKKITAKIERAIRNGDEQLEPYLHPNAMAAKLLKHRFRGVATNRTVLLYCDGQTVADHAWQRQEPDDAD